MDLRRILLEDNTENAQKALIELENTEENYDKLCEFYTECEVKGIFLKPENVQLIIDFIVEYRLMYSNRNVIPEKYEENLSERLKFVDYLVTEYLNHNFQNPIEEIVVLKCVVRVLRPLIHTTYKYDNSNQSKKPILEALLQKVPWHVVQFLICILLTVKSDRKRVQFKFIDDYFQLLVHEDLIRDVLQLVLKCLRQNSFDDEKWRQFHNTYSILQMYYLLLKASYYMEFVRMKEDNNEKTVLRALQVIGECCLKISKLRYEHFDGTIYPMCDVKYFSAELSRERNKLSHFKKLLTERQTEILAESKSEHLEFSRIFYFISDMIQMVRNEIETIVVVEYKTLIENEKVEKLLKRVKGLKISKLKTNPNVHTHYTAEEIAFLSKCGLADNFTCVLLYEIFLLMKNNHLKVKNSDLFSFIKWINNSSQQQIENIIHKLNAISSKPLINITTFMTILVEILPDSIKERYIQIFKNYSITNQIFFTHPRYRFFREDSIIKEFMEKIRGCISNQRDKERFNELEDILLKRRYFKLEFRIFKDAKSILSEWPTDNEKQKVTERFIDNYNDPLNVFVENYNISDYIKVDDFLKRIKWENRNEIIKGLEKVISKDLTDSLEDIFRNFGKNEIDDEIYLLDCFEILKQMEIEQSQDYNYLDFDCSIPVARNMRNFLAHGDIYLEIFCPYSKEVVQSHLKIISKSYKNIKRIGFWRQDDFETIIRDLNKHREWAREAWETLNSSNDLKTMEGIETFKVRDHNNLSVVHYNLMNTNSENKFLVYLIEKVTSNCHFETNPLFEKNLEESSNFNYNNTFELKKTRNTWESVRIYNFSNVKTVELFIDKFLEEQELQRKRRLLCIILCFSCQNLNMFQEVYSSSFQTTELLCYSIASNQTVITSFLLEQIKNDVNFEEILKQAIKRNDDLLVSKLIDRISNVSLKYNINWSKLVISAAKVGNIEILELLSKNIKILNSETRNLLIKTVINCNSSFRICKFVVEKYLSPISKEDSELSLHLSCFNERLDILRYLLEEVVPENHWNEIRKFILVSCFNINFLEIVEYLIEKGAYLNFQSLNDFLPFFESPEIVEVIFKYFGTLTDQQEFKKLTFVRNRFVAEVLHKHGYSFDWFEIESLPLEFILKKNPKPKINLSQLISILWRNSVETMELLLKHLRDHKVKFSFLYLPAIVAEIQIRKKKWLSEIDWKEPTQKDFDDIIRETIIQKCLTYVRMSLRKCKNLNVHLEFEENIDFIIYHNHQILKLFQEFGADLNARYNGKTSLDVAIEEGKGAITDSMRLLSKLGVKCSYDIDFFDLKAQDMLFFGVLEGNLNLIQEALSLGADINFKYKEYRFGTVLHITTYYVNRRESVIRDSILNSGIDTSIRDIDDNTAFDLDQLYDPGVKIPEDHDNISPFNLFWAGAKRNDIDLMEEALTRGADINSVIFETESNSALHLFAFNGQLKTVEFLLKKGADPWQKNKLDQYPIETTIARDNCDIFKILFSENLNLKYYFKIAVRNSSVKIVKFLLESGVDVNTKIYFYHELSVFEYACKYAKNKGFSLAELLIEHNINVTKSDVEYAWRTKNYELLKLISYNYYNYPKTVQELETALDKGLNINLALDSDIRTHLHLACYFQDKESVMFLLQNGANFLRNDSNKKNPITIALESNDSEIKKLFFKPLLVKFCSMFSKYPSAELTDFFNTDLMLDPDVLIVFWFNMILKVSGLLDDDDCDEDDDVGNLTPFELLASGLWLNNINYIDKALDAGVCVNHCLRELIFVSFVLNPWAISTLSSLYDLKFAFIIGRDVLKEMMDTAYELCLKFWRGAAYIYILKSYEIHIRLEIALHSVLNKETNFPKEFKNEIGFNLHRFNDFTTAFIYHLDFQEYFKKAVIMNEVEIVKYLLEKGADVNTNMKIGCSSLMFACVYPNNAGLKLAELLIEHKINVTKSDFEYAWKKKNYELVKLTLTNIFNHPKTVQEIGNALENGLNINLALDSDLITHLHLACYFQDTEIVNYFLENGANFLQNDLNGKNPITIALESNDSEMKKLFFKPLLVKFCSMFSKYPSEEFNDFYITDPEKDSDFIIVFWFDMILWVSGLLDDDGIENLSPFELFASGFFHNNISYIRKAIDSGVDTNQYLSELIFVGLVLNYHNLESFLVCVLKFLKGLDRQMEIGKTYKLCTTFLILASQCKDFEKFELHPRLGIIFENVLKYKRVDSEEGQNESVSHLDNKKGISPDIDLDLVKYFKEAVIMNSLDVVKFLLQKGIDVNTRVRKDYSAMRFACLLPNNKGLKLAEVLIEHKIVIDETDILIALKTKNYEIIKFISYNYYNYPKTVQELETALEKGLNINLAPDTNLKSYLHLACYCQDKEIVNYLLENGANFLQKDLNGKSSITIALRSNSEIKKLFCKPLLLKFYSMFSKYPSEEFIEFSNTDPEKDSDFIIVFWFDMILWVSGLLDDDGIENLSPFELFASGFFHNNISYIRKAIDSGVDTSQYLSELIFVGLVLNNHNLESFLDWVLEFLKGINRQMEIKKANELCCKFLITAIPCYTFKEFELHPRLDEVFNNESEVSKEHEKKRVYNSYDTNDSKEQFLEDYFRKVLIVNKVQINKFLVQQVIDDNKKEREDYSAIKFACVLPTHKGLQLAEVLIGFIFAEIDKQICVVPKIKTCKLAKLNSYNYYKYPKTVQELETALDKGLNINLTLDSDIRTHLHLACYFQDKAIVNYLLKNGANFLQKDLNGDSPITIALESNSEMKKLFFKPLLVKFYSMFSKYPSEEFNDFSNIVPKDFNYIIVFWFDMILRVSGLLDNDDVENLSPFELFVSGFFHNNISYIRKAIDSGVDTNQYLSELIFVGLVLNNQNIKSFLDWVLEFLKGTDRQMEIQKANELCCKFLITVIPCYALYLFELSPRLVKVLEYVFNNESKVSTEFENYGSFINHLNLEEYYRNAVFFKNVQIIKFLLRNGFDVNTILGYNLSALKCASMFPNNEGLKLAEVLIKHKIVIDEMDIFVALQEKNYKIVKLISYNYYNYRDSVQEFETALEKGLNINLAPNSDSRISLHLACYFKDQEIVKFLLENGANFFKKDLERKSPLTIALESNSEIKKLFFKPLLVKFYSMWSSFPSEEFMDFCNTYPDKDINYIIVFWFNMILTVSGLVSNDDIDNLTPFELFASGVWFNNINLIKEAINDGIDTNQCLCELVFVSYVLNGNTEELDETLEFIFLNGGDISRGIQNAKNLFHRLLTMAAEVLDSNNIDLHPRFEKAIIEYKTKYGA